MTVLSTGVSLHLVGTRDCWRQRELRASPWRWGHCSLTSGTVCSHKSSTWKMFRLSYLEVQDVLPLQAFFYVQWKNHLCILCKLLFCKSHQFLSHFVQKRCEIHCVKEITVDANTSSQNAQVYEGSWTSTLFSEVWHAEFVFWVSFRWYGHTLTCSRNVLESIILH